MTTTTTSTEPVGTLCLVLHSHLPWLAHHGSWPVGEEWLYQAWAQSYLPLIDVLARYADRGRRNLLTLGITPVLAAALDDPYTVAQFHTWLSDWSMRADELAGHRDPGLRAVGQIEAKTARMRIAMFEQHWRHGGAPVIRRLVENQTVELLSGPATHPFTPLLDDEVAAFALEVGRDDAAVRFGQRPRGIWAPECGYRPGLEDIYSDAGVSHFMVDGPTLLHVGRSTADAWTVGDTNVVAFGRDLEVTYRVWSPRRGYPGGSWYLDFHTHDHNSGFRPARVTSPQTPSHQKAPYQPALARAAAASDADDFVQVVRARLSALRSQRDGKPATVVVAYDTELFGHWWHEGPIWLDEILTRLPEAGINVTTLSGAIACGAVAGAVSPQSGSWGSGKDFSVWAGPQVTDMVADNDSLQRRWRKVVQAAQVTKNDRRDRALDQLGREALLALSSDWIFMVSKDSAARYARSRHQRHHTAFNRLAGALEAQYDGDLAARGIADQLAREYNAADNPFGHLDGRLLQRQR